MVRQTRTWTPCSSSAAAAPRSASTPGTGGTSSSATTSQTASGDVELLTEAQAMDTVTALSQADCVAVPMERNREVLLGCLPFVLRMGQEVSGKLKYSSHAHTVSCPLYQRERLCSYLLMAERDGIVREYLTEVAQSVGISYRHVFRILGELCREGILERTESGFRIRDRERLRQRSCEAE